MISKIKKNNGVQVILIFIFLFFILIFSVIAILVKDNKKNHYIPSETIEIEESTDFIYTAVNKETCYKKESEIEKSLCLDEIMKRTSYTDTKNIKECLDLENISNKNECLRIMTNKFNNDSCMRILDHKTKNKCITTAAVYTLDVKHCDYFNKEPYEYAECKDRVLAYIYGESDSKEDIEKCKEVKTLEYPKLCYAKSFKYKFDDDCNKVPKEFQDYCVAEKNIRIATDEIHCSFIKLDEYKRLCLLKIELGGDMRKLEKVDTDNDTLTDTNELFTTTDPHNPDTDGDGLLDGEEIFISHTNPRNPDSDEDGLSDYDEIYLYNTYPGKPDTDGDGISDGDEIKAGINPHTGDSDKDGLFDIDEIKFGTDINNSDTDGDGMSDFEETRSGFDPLKFGQDLSDTDGDGLLDIDEIFYGTDRFNPDTDGDGIGDKEEVDNLTNPLGDGDMDFDGDGVSDKEEIKVGSNPGLFD